MAKLWQKNTNTPSAVHEFTVGQDRVLDINLARFDVLGSLAHTKMLASVGLLESDELEMLQAELKLIYKKMETGEFKLADDVEDIHSQVEMLLTEKLGDAGKKIHSARSRNDQVLLDLKMYMRDEIEKIVIATTSLFNLLIAKSNQYKDDLLPGYTHLQLAMPSSFGLWFGAYAESLVDDMIMLHGAYQVVNKNPLGSAAGYGSSFPINRKMTTELLGFDDLNHNVVYAQMGRGKTERIVASAIANIAGTLSRLSMDSCLFMNQNFGFIAFPDDLTTGSSIMPHKKNPDVFELVRAHGNRLMALPNEIMMITVNLPSGYHRDLQLLKEHLFPAFRDLRSCIEMLRLMFSNVSVKKDILNDPKYNDLFTVEELNKLVLEGVPFRDAYKKIGEMVESGEFTSTAKISHSHEGSISNLQNEAISTAFRNVVERFNFSKVSTALEQLLH